MSDYDEGIFPKVSILILAKYDELDLKMTLLNVLQQCYHDYEVFIACSDYCCRSSRSLPEKQGVDIRSFSFGKIPDSALLNTALTQLRGVYVQILFPGYVYLSPHTLRYVMQTALRQQFPSLLYTAKLMQGDEPFQTLAYAPFSTETLHKGQTPTELACCFIRRDLFEKMGDWTTTSKNEYGWNFFSHLNRLEGIHTHGIKRVFMENRAQDASNTLKPITCSHACMRILKTFGPLAMLRYLWGQNE